MDKQRQKLTKKNQRIKRKLIRPDGVGEALVITECKIDPTTTATTQKLCD